MRTRLSELEEKLRRGGAREDEEEEDDAGRCAECGGGGAVRCADCLDGPVPGRMNDRVILVRGEAVRWCRACRGLGFVDCIYCRGDGRARPPMFPTDMATTP